MKYRESILFDTNSKRKFCKLYESVCYMLMFCWVDAIFAVGDTESLSGENVFFLDSAIELFYNKNHLNIRSNFTKMVMLNMQLVFR